MKTLILLLLSLSASFSLYGEVFRGPVSFTGSNYDNLKIRGPSQLRLIKARNLRVRGPVQFHKMEVSGNTCVKGYLTGNQGIFGNLTVIGPMNVGHVVFEDFKVRGPVTAIDIAVQNQAYIEGSVDLQNSRIKSLAVKGDNIVLDQVEVEDILISKTEHSQNLLLKGYTTIKGDIAFESGRGTVEIDGPNVQIIGTVKGATTKRLPTPEKDTLEGDLNAPSATFH